MVAVPGLVFPDSSMGAPHTPGNSLALHALIILSSTGFWTYSRRAHSRTRPEVPESYMHCGALA